jgi:hypothetical protein
MYAMIPAVIFAAVAAALPEAREASVIPRTPLSAMRVKEAEQVCDPYQKLVCCNKDKECGEVKLGSKYLLPTSDGTQLTISQTSRSPTSSTSTALPPSCAATSTPTLMTPTSGAMSSTTASTLATLLLKRHILGAWNRITLIEGHRSDEKWKPVKKSLALCGMVLYLGIGFSPYSVSR